MADGAAQPAAARAPPSRWRRLSAGGVRGETSECCHVLQTLASTAGIRQPDGCWQSPGRAQQRRPAQLGTSRRRFGPHWRAHSAPTQGCVQEGGPGLACLQDGVQQALQPRQALRLWLRRHHRRHGLSDGHGRPRCVTPVRAQRRAEAVGGGKVGMRVGRRRRRTIALLAATGGGWLLRHRRQQRAQGARAGLPLPLAVAVAAVEAVAVARHVIRERLRRLYARPQHRRRGRRRHSRRGALRGRAAAPARILDQACGAAVALVACRERGHKGPAGSATGKPGRRPEAAPCRAAHRRTHISSLAPGSACATMCCAACRKGRTVLSARWRRGVNRCVRGGAGCVAGMGACVNREPRAAGGGQDRRWGWAPRQIVVCRRGCGPPPRPPPRGTSPPQNSLYRPAVSS